MAEMEMEDADEQCEDLTASVHDLDVRVKEAERLTGKRL